MRAFLISVVLLIALVSCVAINNVYINRVADDLLSRLESLPDVGASDCTVRANELLAAGEEQVEWVRLSVGYTVVDRVCEQTATLVACAECGDLYGFRTALALLRDAVGDMRRLEVLSISNIL